MNNVIPLHRTQDSYEIVVLEKVSELSTQVFILNNIENILNRVNVR